MESKDSEPQENSQGNQPVGRCQGSTPAEKGYDVQSLYDNRVIKICTQYPEGEGFEQRKSGQENEVERVCVALPVKQPEIDENTEHGEIVRPRAVSDQHEAA